MDTSILDSSLGDVGRDAWSNNNNLNYTQKFVNVRIYQTYNFARSIASHLPQSSQQDALKYLVPRSPFKDQLAQCEESLDSILSTVAEVTGFISAVELAEWGVSHADILRRIEKEKAKDYSKNKMLFLNYLKTRRGENRIKKIIRTINEFSDQVEERSSAFRDKQPDQPTAVKEKHQQWKKIAENIAVVGHDLEAATLADADELQADLSDSESESAPEPGCVLRKQPSSSTIVQETRLVELAWSHIRLSSPISAMERVTA